MAFETPRIFFSVRTSSLETKLKEKFFLFVYSHAIARILGLFLDLAIAFRVGSSTLSAKESHRCYLPKNHSVHVWDIEIFNNICKEAIQFFCNFFHNLLIKSCFILRLDLFVQEDKFF